MLHRIRRIRGLLTALFWLVLLILVAERASYAGVFQGRATGGAVAGQILLAVPAGFYLAALWQFRAVAEIAGTDQPFAIEAARRLRWAGRLLVIGAISALLAAQMTARLIELDISTLIIAAIGCALALVAGLLDQARAVQDELDEIF